MSLTLKKQSNLPVALAITLLMTLAAAPAEAAGVSADVLKQYSAMDPFSFILLEFGLIVVLALVGHILSRHYCLPNMLGELLIGVIAGNILYWLDWSPVFFMVMHLSDAGEVFKAVWTSNLSVTDTVTHLYSPDIAETKEFINRLTQVLTTILRAVTTSDF